MRGLDGNTVRLSDSKGKIRIIDFWATWCPPCQAEIPQLNALQAKYADDLVVIGIALDRGGPDVVKSFAQQNKINYSLVMGDTKTVIDFGRVESIPTAFVIDPEGKIYNKHVGYKPASTFEKDLLALKARIN